MSRSLWIFGFLYPSPNFERSLITIAHFIDLLQNELQSELETFTKAQTFSLTLYRVDYLRLPLKAQ